MQIDTIVARDGQCTCLSMILKGSRLSVAFNRCSSSSQSIAFGITQRYCAFTAVTTESQYDVSMTSYKNLQFVTRIHGPTMLIVVECTRTYQIEGFMVFRIEVNVAEVIVVSCNGTHGLDVCSYGIKLDIFCNHLINRIFSATVSLDKPSTELLAFGNSYILSSLGKSTNNSILLHGLGCQCSTISINVGQCEVWLINHGQYVYKFCFTSLNGDGNDGIALFIFRINGRSNLTIIGRYTREGILLGYHGLSLGNLDGGDHLA